MFKASIALVLIAFAALAYGWIAGNDAVLFGSIGASALAGLALLSSTMKDRKAAGYPSEPPPERPARERSERTRDADFPPPAGKRRGGRRLEPDEMTRRLNLGSEEDEERFEAESITAMEPIKPSRRPTGRNRLPAAPEGAAWAGPDADDEEEESDFEVAGYEGEQAAFDAGFPEEPYPGEEDRGAAARSPEGVAAADDFRSRLAAVLGSQEEGRGQPEPTPAPKPRVRRGPAQDEPAPAEAPKPRGRRTPARAPEAAEAPAPAKRGRKKAKPVIDEPDAELGSAEQAQDPEPDWIRLEDVPRVTRATQPGGGFARPDVPGGITPYRPRRPGVPQDAPAEQPDAPKRRKAPAERTAESKVKPAGAKRPPAAKPSVTRPTGSPAQGKAKQPDPDAPPPRRGRPPKPKP